MSRRSLHALVVVAATLCSACGNAPSRDGDAGPGSDGSITSTPDATAIDPEPRLADNVSIREVAVFQAVQVTLAVDGTAVAPRNAPVVAGRDALIRVYVAPGAGWSSKSLTGELVVTVPGASPVLLTETETITSASSTDDTSSTFDFLVPAAQVTADATFAVRVTDPTATPAATGTLHDARYPRDGSNATLDAQTDAGGITIVLVPVQYDRDGSGRLPDTSPGQLALIESLLTSIYPIARVTLSVHAPLPWNNSLTWNGNFDFGDLNQALVNLKSDDGAPSSTYYYGMVKPAETYSGYCGSSCVTGQAFVVRNVASGGQRVGSGIGYAGERWAMTLAHEIGHMHGRSHAPCDTSSPDPSYPHQGGSIGVWGYDPRSSSFLSPQIATDLMGYCDDRWISDYTFSALFERIQALGSSAARASQSRRAAHRFLRVHPGQARWGRRVMVPPSNAGDSTPIEFVTRGGRQLGTTSAATFREAHGQAIWLLVPTPPPGTSHVMVTRSTQSEPVRVAW